MSTFTRILATIAVASRAAGGGSSASSGVERRWRRAPANGGTLAGRIPANPDHLERALGDHRGLGDPRGDERRAADVPAAGGGAGSQVVPDLATAMPKITGGGRIYTFHLALGRDGSRRRSTARCGPPT